MRINRRVYKVSFVVLSCVFMGVPLSAFSRKLRKSVLFAYPSNLPVILKDLINSFQLVLDGDGKEVCISGVLVVICDLAKEEDEDVIGVSFDFSQFILLIMVIDSFGAGISEVSISILYDVFRVFGGRHCLSLHGWYLRVMGISMVLPVCAVSLIFISKPIKNSPSNTERGSSENESFTNLGSG